VNCFGEVIFVRGCFWGWFYREKSSTD